MKRILSLIILALIVVNANAAIGKPTLIDVCISSYTPGNKITAVKELVTSLMLTEMDTGDVLILSESANSDSTAQITFTEPFEGKNSKKTPVLLKKYYPREMANMKQLFEKLAKNPPDSFPELNYVEHFDLLSDRRNNFSDYNYQAILIGAPIHKESGLFTMENRYFSDGFLFSPESPYNCKNKSENLKGIKVHLIYDGSQKYFSPYNPVVHKEKTERFLSLLISAQGGELITFSTELGLLKNLNGIEKSRKKYAADESDLKASIYTFTPPEINTKLWATDAPKVTAPPSQYTGKLFVGLKWTEPIDLDIYVANNKGELSFKTPENADGLHIKDYLEAPDKSNGYESVAYHDVQDIRNIKIWVNHYSGTVSTPIKAQVRVLFDGKVYSQDITLNSRQGNKGEFVNGARTGECWQPVDILKVAGLSL